MNNTIPPENKLQEIINSDMFQAAMLVCFMAALYAGDKLIAG